MKLIDIHTHHLGTQLTNVSVYNLVRPDIPLANYPPHFSIGLHPWDINRFVLDEALIQIDFACKQPGCIYLGEIGIDKTCSTAIAIQQKVFEAQIDLANQNNRGILIHNVRALPEIIRSFKRVTPHFGIIFHGFFGNIQTAKQLLSLGAKLSFGKQLFKHKATQNCFREIPADQVFFETDTSEMSIIEVYQQAAYLTNKSVGFWQQQLFINFNNFLKLFYYDFKKHP